MEIKTLEMIGKGFTDEPPKARPRGSAHLWPTMPDFRSDSKWKKRKNGREKWEERKMEEKEKIREINNLVRIFIIPSNEIWNSSSKRQHGMKE